MSSKMKTTFACLASRINQFVDISCAWADKDHLHKIVKPNRDNNRYVFVKVTQLFSLFRTGNIFCDKEEEMFFSKRANIRNSKGISKMNKVALISPSLNKCVYILDHFYHVLITN